MNLFSTKDEVDQHVKKLLSISKNSHDNDLQCQIIAKLYFDVKEYMISKNYIERFIKTNENSRNGLSLKAKIHEHLVEFEQAAKCYERLYDVFSEECDLSKVCECLLKCDKINDKQIQKCISILEKSYPNNEFYVKLKAKLSPNVSFNYNIDEINQLKNQMKLNVNDDLKIRFLRILDNQNGVVDSLIECSSILNKYAILDNIEVVKLCLSIFRKNFKDDISSYKLHYCVILISLLRNQSKICDFDRRNYLLEFMNLLKNEKLCGHYKEICVQFLYYLTSFAHCQSIKENNLTECSIKIILAGYLMINSVEIDNNNQLTAPLSNWLKSQSNLVMSISNHFVYRSSISPSNDKNNNFSFIELGKLVWNNIDYLSDYVNHFVEIISTKHKNLQFSECISVDIRCILNQFSDLKLVGWQIACYNEFQMKDNFKYNLSKDACLFIGELVTKLFPKVPIYVPNKRCPDNISKIDIITFVIGTFLTYQKSLNSSNYDGQLPYPFELWQEIRIPDVIHKWWQAACDFTLQNKRNTSIGALKDLLKSGLDSLQLVDNQMSEVLKLQLGRVINQCANCYDDSNDNERDALKLRAIAYYIHALRPSKAETLRQFKQLPLTTYSQNNAINRQKSFTSLTNSFGNYKTKELFDTDNMSNDIVDEWKFDAYLVIIEHCIQQGMRNIIDFDELEELAMCAEKLKDKSPFVHMAKSKIFLDKAQWIQSNKKDNNTHIASEFHRSIQMAKSSANDGIDYLYTLEELDRLQMHDLLQQQLNEISCAQSLEYSIFEFTCPTGETSNSNKHYNHSSIMYNNELFNQSSIMSNDQSIIMDNYKIDQLQSDVAVIGSSQDKIGSEIGHCVNQVNYLSQSVQNEFEKLKRQCVNQKEHQNDLYSRLSLTIDQLTKKSDKLESRLEMFTEKNCLLEQSVEYLIKNVNQLTIENALLKNEVQEIKLASNIINQTIQPGINKLTISIGNNMQQLFNNVSRQVMQMETIQLLLPLYNVEQQQLLLTEDSTSNISIPDESLTTNTLPKLNNVKPTIIKNQNLKSEPIVDLSQFSKNKWECPTCSCMNNDNISLCPACYTKKLSTISEKEPPKPEPKLDLLKFSQNKWECPTCVCMNDDNISLCPACGTKKLSNSNSVIPQKPNNLIQQSQKEPIKTQSKFDLSKFTVNKWECPICVCMVDNNLTTCAACSYTKESSPKTIQLPLTVKNNTSFVFGTNSDSNKDTAIKFGGSSSVKNIDAPLNFGSSKYSTALPISNIATPKTETLITPKSTNSFTFGTSTVTSGLANNYTKNDSIDFGFGNKEVNSSSININKVIPIDDNWTCFCTTINPSNKSNCKACSEPRNSTITTIKAEMQQSEERNLKCSDSDSDVIFIGEDIQVTEEQKERARALMLPDNFYYYENLPDRDGDDEYTDSESNNYQDKDSLINKIQPEINDKPLETKTSFTFQPNFIQETKAPLNKFTFGLNYNNDNSLNFGSFKSDVGFADNVQSSWSCTNTKLFTKKPEPEENQADNGESCENPEDYDPHYQPIIALPDKIQVVTGEEDSECLFRKRGKLFKFVNNAWNERGIGEMKILRSNVNGTIVSRLVMRREQVHKVCCNHAIQKLCPSFQPMSNSKTSICWFAEDFSEGTLVKEKFAIRFKFEADLKEFMDIVTSLQDEM